ncbi:MAG TPA: AAA family ATPase [Gemmataceae bacterium]|nr:AAA family ATPase [Gemmataceae bacterium]
MSESNHSAHDHDEGDYLRIASSLMTDRALTELVSAFWKPDEIGGTGWNLMIAWVLQHFREHKKPPDFRVLDEFYYRPHVEEHGESDKLEKRMMTLKKQLRADKGETAHAEYVADLAFKQYHCELFRHVRDDMLSERNLNGNIDETRKKFNAIELPLRPKLLVPASHVKDELVHWLWPGFLARGEITMIDGLPGEGKSQLLIDVAARVSRGWPMPPDPSREVVNKPQNVLILSKEDSWEHTIKPRLRAAHADLERVFGPPESRTNRLGLSGTSEDIRFPRDIEMITRGMREYRIRLLIVDPILAYLGSGTDANVESHVRDFLQPLLDAVRELNAAAAFVRHFRKDAAGAIHRGVGSQAWTAVCRAR